MANFRLDGKRALVTGASKGIGFGIAQGLAEVGADIVMVARNPQDLESARQKVAQIGREATAYSFDLEMVEEIDAFYARTVEEVGRIDVLVNNAGDTLRCPAESIRLDEWNHIITLNLTAVFALCRAFARERIDSGARGKIINIASVMSEGARPTTAAYTASKGGIRQLTKALAVDWAQYGINVNAIGPGFIRTPLTQPLQHDPTFDAWVRQRTPLGRWGTPKDLAGAAVFLAGDASDFVTGQTLYVDGGWLAAF